MYARSASSAIPALTDAVLDVKKYTALLWIYFLQLEKEFMRDKKLDIRSFYENGELHSNVIYENYYILETILTSPWRRIQYHEFMDQFHKYLIQFFINPLVQLRAYNIIDLI